MSKSSWSANKIFFVRFCASVLFVITVAACDNEVETGEELHESNSLKQVVLEVGEELRELGFPIDCNKISIEVKDAQEMVAVFKTLSNQSRLEVKDYTPFGPSVSKEKGEGTRLAFYDPNSQSIVFKKGSFKDLTKGYLAHELAHAYQDQKWGYDQIWQSYQENPTLEMFNVTQFIIEGHAELVRHAYEQKHVTPQDANRIGVQLGKMSENDCIPCHTKQSLSTLPYVFGTRFLVNQYREGGWNRVESAFTTLPSSTEQIIHENKFKGDEPTIFSLPIWENPALPAKPVLNGSLGEAFLLAKLSSMGMPAEIAFSAASGWDGDVAQVYQLLDGREILAWRLIFDRVVDAEQLEYALRDFSADSYATRMGRVIDWTITKDPELRKKMHLFLSKHRLSAGLSSGDEQSTNAQEMSIRMDAVLFDNLNYVPKIADWANL